jgi:flagellar hook-associated protein 1 FlgK
MSSLLSIGVKALSANQGVLQVTGQNIANVNTTGYSRQSVRLESLSTGSSTTQFSGAGVKVAEVQRAHSAFLNTQVSAAKSREAADTLRLSKLQELQSVFPVGEDGIGRSISDMLNSLAEIGSAPPDLTSRYIFLTLATEVASRLRNTMNNQVADMASSVSTELGEKVQSANGLLQRVASLNVAIAKSNAQGLANNELLDQRDLAVQELNQLIATRQMVGEDGMMTLYAGNQSLLNGQEAATLTLSANPEDSTQQMLQVTRRHGSVALDTALLGGGEISALMTFQQDDLPWMVNQLGHLALTLGLSINQQHRYGLTLDNQLGTDLFNLTQTIQGFSTSNTAAGSVSFLDPTQLRPSDYRLNRKTDGSYEVVRLEDQSVHAFASVSDIELDGLQFNVTSLNTGESLLFKPYARAAGEMDVVFSSPRELAVASQIQLGFGANNTGTLGLSSLRVYETPTLDPVTLRFSDSSQYDILAEDGTVLESGEQYVPGVPIRYNGWELIMIGTPRSGDEARLSPPDPTFIARNAGNANALMGLRDNVMGNGSKLIDVYANVLSELGVKTQSAGYAANVSSTIYGNLEASRQAVTGVNLDEEAARLLQFQQSYQAAAKTLQTAQTLFDAVLRAVG